MKKITLYSELAYVLAILILSFSVAMVSAADLGLSMIVAPAYILSQKLQFLTFGQCEYVVHAILFILFCILLIKVKLVYFVSFLNCIVYGATLDLWRIVIPMFNPEITEPCSMSMPVYDTSVHHIAFNLGEGTGCCHDSQCQKNNKTFHNC